MVDDGKRKMLLLICSYAKSGGGKQAEKSLNAVSTKGTS